jgi:hypothetical protein
MVDPEGGVTVTVTFLTAAEPLANGLPDVTP